jgi:hypothetical protein
MAAAIEAARTTVAAPIVTQSPQPNRLRIASTFAVKSA